MEGQQMPMLPAFFVERDRVNSILEKNTGVFFLIGREGCGKTSALARFCQGKEHVFWHSFKREDNYGPYFENLFSSQPVGGETGKGAGNSGLLSYLDRQEIACVVFDNLQVLTNRRILGDICLLLERNTGARKVFLAMSDRPAPCFSRFIAAGKYQTVTDRELCFTREELGELAKAYFVEAHGDADKYAGQLLALTGGWPIAACFLLRYLKDSGSGLESIMHMEMQDVLLDTMLYDYIDYEIYDRFSMKEKLFLGQSAVFRKLDAGLCRTCMGEEAAGTIFRKLQGRGLLCSAGTGGTRQYQPFIRLFLADQITPRRRLELEKQAYGYYIHNKDFEEAFYYMKNDPGSIRSLLRKYGKEMLQQGLLGLAGQCLSVLKAESVEWTAQELGIAAEYCYRIGKRDQMEACLNAADSMFGKENQYGMYRSMYRGLFNYEKDPDKYEKQINNAIFFLTENSLPFPFLMDREQQIFYKIRKDKESGLQESSSKKIKVLAFGTFRAIILEDGKELSWRTKKGCELFAYLMQLDGQAVERKTLLSQLWQEEMPNNAVAMLHNMFYNIRKELSYYNLEYMIQYKNKKYSMDASLIQSDLEQIQEAAGYVEKKDIRALVQKRHLFDSYWGIYLEDLDNVWIRVKQDYYEKIFEKGCFLLGTDFMEQGRFEDAVIYFKNALAVSCYSEKIVGKILACYGKTKDFISAKKQYEDFCRLLEKELGIKPGKELQDSYRACIGSIKGTG